MKYICLLLCLYCSASACKDTDTKKPVSPKVEMVNKEVKVVAEAKEVFDPKTESAKTTELKPEDKLEEKISSEPQKETTEVKSTSSTETNSFKPQPQPQKPTTQPTPVLLEKVEEKPQAIETGELVSTKKEVIKSKEVIDAPENTPIVTKPKKTEPKKTESKKIQHQSFDALLSKYVSASGKVDYNGIRSEANILNAYLESLEGTQLSALSKNEQLAFWINAYNAYTIKLIVDNYPVNSITDLESGKPWDKKWINLDGQNLSLNNIENDIIRPQFNEPRIHFAVNCAAKSCPPLLNQAWTAENLEANFTKQTKAFVNASKHNILSASNITVSKIFEWYAVDFGDLISFLNKYSATAIDAGATISYKEYDWALNN